MQMDVPGVDRLAHSIADALALVPVGRSLLYEEIRAGRLRTFKIGSRTLIADEDLKSWLSSYRGLALPGGAVSGDANIGQPLRGKGR